MRRNTLEDKHDVLTIKMFLVTKGLWFFDDGILYNLEYLYIKRKGDIFILHCNKNFFLITLINFDIIFDMIFIFCKSKLSRVSQA